MFNFTPSVKELKPGEYVRQTGLHRDRIVICCPACEGEYQLARHYMITVAGVVNPQIRCPLHGCQWSKPATFAKWGKS